jgi:DNA-binding response OmpR family regulator
LLRDASHRPGPIDRSLLHTVAQSAEFLSQLLWPDMLARAGNLPPPRVVAVDDDRELLPAMVESLESAHLPTIACIDGRAALTALEGSGCDLILMDIGLPDMSGLEMCASIRALPKHDHTPIVLLSGEDAMGNLVQGPLKGASDFIGKPFNMFELMLKAHTWALKNQLAVA